MSRNTHQCPGRCGKSVRRELFACPPCWWRLPQSLRTAINLAYPRRSTNPAAHRAALADALAWYRANNDPAGGA